ncbi:MAG: hypothetical protein H7338_03595, partial [Candidatus Sericytochromatia bacterium]|nr:hypothetical protein [Candidatus Sericytochromatia bacterium]
AMPLRPIWVEDWSLDHLGFTLAVRADRAKGERNLALIHRWLDDTPADGDAWYYLGAEYQTLGRLSDAKASYLRSLDSTPGVVEPSLARVNLLGIWESLGDWAAVVEAARRWQADGHSFPDYWLIVGRAFLSTGRKARAQTCFERAAAFAGGGPCAFETGGARTWKPAAYLALLAGEQGNWSRTLQGLRPWLPETRHDPFVQRLYLHALLAMGDTDAATAHCADLLAASGATDVAIALAEVLDRFGPLGAPILTRFADWAGGFSVVAARLARQSAWGQLLAFGQRWEPVVGAAAVLAQGQAAAGLGEDQVAAGLLTLACGLDPVLPAAWIARAELAARTGTDPMAHWQRALALAPDSVPILATLIDHYAGTGDMRRAEDLVRRLRDIDPQHPAVWRQQASQRQAGN